MGMLVFAFFTFHLFLGLLSICWLIGAANMIFRIFEPRERQWRP